jgi:uncharacterized membrane protein
LNIIQKEIKHFTKDSFLSLEELNKYREKYITEYVKSHFGKPSNLEKTVIDTIKERGIISDKLDGDDYQELTLGQRLADKVASFGGSWTFILSFGFFLFCWILTNVYWLGNRGFDPFPFILLNLILSCIAALQAPVIMMSQNRQEEKDRDRAKKDYMINLKSELEIRSLNEKIDHLIINQQQELLEMQKVQIEMIKDILKRYDKENPSSK